MNKKKRLVIIDSNSVIHRAFHALPPLTDKKGNLSNAVYGFFMVFFKTIRELNPDFIVACFDFPAPTFRHKKYKKYKDKRPRAPKELYDQILKVKQVLESLSVSVFEKEGFEADDLIGTLGHKFSLKQVFPEIETIILSSDSDVLQLINENTRVCSLKKGVSEATLYDKKAVKEKYGFDPEQMIDYKALRGDPSDSIPGAPGIGEKTAVDLIKKFATVDELYEHLERDSKEAQSLKPKLKEILIKSKDQVLFSRELAQIELNVPLKFNLNDCRWRGCNREQAAEALKDFGFESIIKHLPEAGENNAGGELRLW